MPSCLRDGLPDAWGRRLIDYQYPRFQKNGLLAALADTLDFSSTCWHAF